MGLYNSKTTDDASNARKYGWVRDLPDHRDRYLNFESKDDTPSTFSLTLKVPVYNQGQLGSCTANAIACGYQYDEMKEDCKDESTPSRLFIYYNERAIEGTTGTDSGAQLRDGIKTISKTGVCPEKDWPYDISKFTQKPPASCYTEAENNKATQYKRVNQDEEQIKLALTAGFPIIFGVSVYPSFESIEVLETGNVPMPSKDEKLLGGHAITLYGFDDEKKRFLFRNSWGTVWGAEGNGTLPYEYVLSPDLAADFWTVTKIVEEQTLAEKIKETLEVAT
jgi:C1A family cysteine protease